MCVFHGLRLALADYINKIELRWMGMSFMGVSGRFHNMISRCGMVFMVTHLIVVKTFRSTA